MTREKKTMGLAWEKIVRKILEGIENDQKAAFVTLGDPMTYTH